MDPRKLLGELVHGEKSRAVLERLASARRDQPFRHLGRRLVQAMIRATAANPVAGKRSAPGKYLVLRVVATEPDRELWETQFAEGRSALEKEMVREAEVREIELRSPAHVECHVLSEAAVARGEVERLVYALFETDDAPGIAARLHHDGEVILPRRTRTLRIETEPAGAQVYVDHRPVGVTPCAVEDLSDGEHTFTFHRPGSQAREEVHRIEASPPGERLLYRVALEPEPTMGVLQIRTFPSRARITIGDEQRLSPVTWRLPCGGVQVLVELDDFAPQVLDLDLPDSTETRPYAVQIRLDYIGPFRDQVAGRIAVYRIRDGAPRRTADPEDRNSIGRFFADTDPILEPEDGEPGQHLEFLGERELRRGVLLIGREDPRGGLRPDIRLIDAENSVSRGCHAWIHVYADAGTGAEFNAFLIGNNSPAGIRVDGSLVTETRKLSEESEVEIGNFRLRLLKAMPEARVEFDF